MITTGKAKVWSIILSLGSSSFFVNTGQGRPVGVVVYQYTRKKFAKIPKNTQNSSKYTQNYTQVYFIPEIQRKWYTEYPYLCCNIPYTQFKKPPYTVYPKTLADPDRSHNFHSIAVWKDKYAENSKAKQTKALKAVLK